MLLSANIEGCCPHRNVMERSERSHSLEEQAKLAHSNKKVKNVKIGRAHV